MNLYNDFNFNSKIIKNKLNCIDSHHLFICYHYIFMHE